MNNHILTLLFLSFVFMVTGNSMPSSLESSNTKSRHLRDSNMNTHSNLTSPQNEITIVTHCSVDYLVYLPYMIERWSGPIIISVLIDSNGVLALQKFKQNHHFSSQVTFIPVKKDNNAIYPINKLRNISIKAVTTKYMLILDIDMLPSVDLDQSLLSLPSSLLNNSKNVIVIPAFEYKYRKQFSNKESVLNSISNSYPKDKKELVDCIDTYDCLPIHYQANTHLYHYEEWFFDFNKESKYSQFECFKNHIQEPYIFMKKTVSMPLFDERFVDFGYNHIQYIEYLRYTGYTFSILNHGFIIEMPNDMNQIKREWYSHYNDPNFKQTSLYKQFLTELKHNHKDKSVVYFCD